MARSPKARADDAVGSVADPKKPEHLASDLGWHQTADQAAQESAAYLDAAEDQAADSKSRLRRLDLGLRLLAAADKERSL